MSLDVDMNFLLFQALNTISTLPFHLTQDTWRWNMFRGDIPEAELNTQYWADKYKKNEQLAIKIIIIISLNENVELEWLEWRHLWDVIPPRIWTSRPFTTSSRMPTWSAILCALFSNINLMKCFAPRPAMLDHFTNAISTTRPPLEMLLSILKFRDVFMTKYNIFCLGQCCN